MLVLLCGCLATIAGTLIIICMPLAWILRILLAAVFVTGNIRELLRLVAGAERLQRLRLGADGNISGRGPDGRDEPLELLSGSIVLKRLAWLRLRFADGREYAELFRGDPGTDPEWRRLQLIWQHRRRAIGGQVGS